jgi:thiol-disulfide isomerase/thioredoxin
MHPVRPLAALAACALLGLTACGQAGTSDPQSAPTASTPAATGSPAPTATPPGSSRPAAAVPEQLRFSGSTVDGKAFSGEALAGKPAVLWFWAPWCTVCRAEAPEIDAAVRRFGDRVQFVGVAGRGPLPDMRRFVADTGLGGFPHVVDGDGALWSRFGIPAQPAFAFVGRDGSIEVSLGRLPAADLTARVDRLARG